LCRLRHNILLLFTHFRFCCVLPHQCFSYSFVCVIFAVLSFSPARYS
jgi:hypothetical protein